MLAPAYNQYSMPAPDPAYYNPILDSVLSPSFFPEEYDPFQFDASYIPMQPQPAPYNDTITSEFSPFTWSSASTSGPVNGQHSPPPPTQPIADFTHLPSQNLAPNRPASVFRKPSDAPPPNSGGVVPATRSQKRASRRAASPLRVPASLIVPPYPPLGYVARPPPFDLELVFLEWALALADWDEATQGSSIPELPEANVVEPTEQSCVQQIWDGCDSQADVRVHPTVNSNLLNYEENDRTPYSFDLPTGSGQSQSSGRSGAGHVTQRPQQGQSGEREGERTMGSQEDSTKRIRDNSLDADVELERPFLPKRLYRSRRQRGEIFIPYQPKRDEAPKSKGKRKADDSEDGGHDSRARKTVRLAPEWESVEQ